MTQPVFPTVPAAPPAATGLLDHPMHWRRAGVLLALPVAAVMSAEPSQTDQPVVHFWSYLGSVRLSISSASCLELTVSRSPSFATSGAMYARVSISTPCAADAFQIVSTGSLSPMQRIAPNGPS